MLIAENEDDADFAHGVVERIGDGERTEKAGEEFTPVEDFTKVGLVKWCVSEAAKNLVEKAALARGTLQQEAEGGLLDDEAVVHFPDWSSSARAASNSAWEIQAGLSKAV